MRLAPAALAALVLLGGCSSGTPAAKPTPAPTSAKPKPHPKPKPKPSGSATPTPTPSATTPPPVPTGDAVGTAGALLAVVAAPGPARKVGGAADCASVFPEVTRPTCGGATLDGGGLLWVKGRMDGAGYVRLLVQDPASGAYVARYQGRDDGRSWKSVSIAAAPLAGHGTDGVLVVARLVDGGATYDLLTWVKGGPLVLRGHRPPLADGRVAARDGGVDEYARAVDGTYVRRRVGWDGRQFVVTAGTRWTGALPPR
jgi:hypothetical protein